MAEKFVTMEKDGARIEVSPLTVDAHRAIGWRIVEPIQEPEAAPAETKVDPLPPVRKSSAKKAEK